MFEEAILCLFLAKKLSITFSVLTLTCLLNKIRLFNDCTWCCANKELDGRFVYSNRRVISGFHYVVVTLCGCLGEG